MRVCENLYICMLYILLYFYLCGIYLTSGSSGMNEEFIVVDGILIRKSDQINARSEHKTKKEQIRMKEKVDEEDIRLYNESRDITKHLPNKCQGLQWITSSRSQISKPCRTFTIQSVFFDVTRYLYMH